MDSARPFQMGAAGMAVEVETRNVAGQVTALGSAGQFALVMDRPAEAGGGGRGFNGGQLMYLAIAGCISNDLSAKLSDVASSWIRSW